MIRFSILIFYPAHVVPSNTEAHANYQEDLNVMTSLLVK
jgi:hypothetical protein